MTNIFVFSAANGAARLHWRDTIEKGLPLQSIEHLLDATTRAQLTAAYGPTGTAYIWAGRTGGQDQIYWDAMEPGDLLLGYRNRAIQSASWFVSKVQSTNIGQHAWPDEMHRPYDLIYFMTRPTFIDRPIADSPYFGAVYQGLRRLASSARVLQDFGSLERFAQVALGAAVGLPPQHARRGRGLVQLDSKARIAIERRAVDLARERYETAGYSVEDTGATHPFDLRCNRNEEEVRVEVKGTSTAGECVILTAGEVRHARTAPCRVDFILVTEIEIRREADAVEATGGRLACVLESWAPLDSDLEPTEYRYSIPRPPAAMP